MKVEREKMLAALAAVTPGLATKEVVEQSSCFVFTNNRIITFNDEISCSVDSPLEGVEGAVKATPLFQLLNKMSEETLDIFPQDSELRVHGARRRSGVRMEAEVELPVDAIDLPEKWRKLPEEFLNAARIVSRCAGADDSEFCLTCIHIHSDFVEACDDIQAARYPLAIKLQQPIIIRRDALKHTFGMDMVAYGETEDWFHLRNKAGMIVSCRRYVEEYPDLDQTGIFKPGKGKIKLPQGLVSAAEKAAVFSSENVEMNNVIIDLRTGKLKIIWSSR